MKKILKKVFITILAILILAAFYFLSKWKSINFDNNIGNSTEIKNLDKKFYDHTYLIFDSTKVATDFEIFNQQKDTVNFNFTATQSPKYKNLTTFIFKSGDGFVGIDINVLKYKNFFYCFAESYTDNIGTFDFLKPDEYHIKKQKLTLNKENYSIGDSIFGKIELEIKFRPNDSIYNAKGYFRGILK